MKEPALQDWACRLLEDQLERLGALRNANPRDSGFKLWRQTTLTVIQRVWPGNLQRSEKFRRIPFTAPSAKPNRAQVKEHYERGCGEAATYLRELIVEIQNGGLDPSKLPGKAAEPAATERDGASSIAAKLAAPLPGEVQSSPSVSPSRAGSPPPVAPPPPTAPPPPIPGFQTSSLSASQPAPKENAKTPPPSAPVSPTPPPLAAGDKRAEPQRPAKAPRKTDRRVLKEMLGFVDPTSSSAPPPIEQPYASELPGATFGEPRRDAEEDADLEPPMRAIASEPEASEEPISFLPVAEDPVSSREPQPAMALPALSEDPDIGDNTDDLLRSSPLFRAATHPVEPVKVLEPAAPSAGPKPSNAVAAALGALASEVASLGVPEGKRAAARAALTDLARQIEDRSATWDTLRDAFGLVLDYPPLARRAIPLLLPFLDLE